MKPSTTHRWARLPRARRVLLLLAGLLALGLGLAQPVWAVADGGVQGHVFGVDGQVATDVTVYFYRDSESNPESNPEPDYVATTDSAGFYTASLPAGIYKVQYYPGDVDLQPEYYDDAHTLASAETVSVVAGSPTVLENARFDSGAKISGAITGPTGSQLNGLDVVAYVSVGGDWVRAYTNIDLGDGDYALRGLASGTYRVCADTDGWSGCVGGTTVQDAADIVVDAPTDAIGRTISMARLGHVAGRVLDGAGNPLEGITIKTRKNGVAGAEFEEHAQTDASGEYAVYGTPGTYVLQFVDSTGTLPSEYYDNVRTAAAATPLTITHGGTTPAHDAVLGSADEAPTQTTPSPPRNVTQPSIAGTTKVGNQITANPGTWSTGASDAVAFTYLWKAGTTVLGTGRSLVLGANLANRTIAVAVTAKGAHPTSTTTSSAGARVAQGTFSFSSNPSILGRAKIKQVLSYSAERVSPSPAKRFQWLRDGRSISGATGSTYQLRKGDESHRFSLRVTYLRTGYVSASRVTTATGTVKK